MPYPIRPEFGAFARFNPPVTRPLLPLINLILGLLPRKRSGFRPRRVRIPTRDGAALSALLYRPAALCESAPCLIYYPGGGFVMKPAPSHYALAATYAEQASAAVLLVRYRLAPRHRYPVPQNDCTDAYLFAAAHAEALGIDRTRIAVGGDSAGGCLAANVCRRARDAGGGVPCFQLLVYPVTSTRMDTGSMRAFADTPMWNARLNRRMWRWYLPRDCDAADAAPLEQDDFSGLPGAYVETAEYDCLRDEGAAYADALSRAGVRVERFDTAGTMHGFDGISRCAYVLSCIRRRTDALRAAFARQGEPPTAE